MAKTKQRLELEQAEGLAGRIMAELGPGCERIAIAGSIRRRKALIGDIELVAIPRIGPRPDMGLFAPEASLLDPILAKLEHEKRIVRQQAGDKLKRYLIPPKRQGRARPIQLDLFLTTPEGWGYALAIRTGPAEYSKWLVTRKHAGGPLQYGFRCHEGHVWRAISGSNEVEGTVKDIDGHLYVLHPVPEEADFFNLIDGGWKPPEQRRL